LAGASIALLARRGVGADSATGGFLVRAGGGTYGIWLGAVELPVDRYPMQIGDNWVLMGGESDSGVQQVFLYDLIKP
jgi:hypothetical protein